MSKTSSECSTRGICGAGREPGAGFLRGGGAAGERRCLLEGRARERGAGAPPVADDAVHLAGAPGHPVRLGRRLHGVRAERAELEVVHPLLRELGQQLREGPAPEVGHGARKPRRRGQRRSWPSFEPHLVARLAPGQNAPFATSSGASRDPSQRHIVAPRPAPELPKETQANSTGATGRPARGGARPAPASGPARRSARSACRTPPRWTRCPSGTPSCTPRAGRSRRRTSRSRCS